MAILALWVVMSLLLSGRVAQDAVPYVAAGHLARSQPADVYAARHGDLFDLPPSFAGEWCRIAPRGTDCANLAVAFVATPMVIPLAIALTAFGNHGGTFLMQLGAAVLLAAGMWLLWVRLAHRSRGAPAMLLVSAVLLTPMAMGPIGLGQTSPILFLSVCLGLRDRTRRRSIATAVVWAAASALKVFPAALTLVLLWRRRWRTLGIAAAILAVLALVTLVLVDPLVWGDFVRSTLELNGHTTTNPYNGAVDALVIRLLGSSDSTMVAVVARIFTLVVGAAVCWFGMRHTDDDTRWAAGYVALLVVTPLVWWHYTWVVIGALAIAIDAQPRLNDRVMGVLPLAAAITFAPSIPNANGHSWPVVQGVLLLAGAATFCVLARRSATVRSAVATDQTVVL